MTTLTGGPILGGALCVTPVNSQDFAAGPLELKSYVFAVPNADRAYAVLKARAVVLAEPLATHEFMQIRTSHFPESKGNWIEIHQHVFAFANWKAE